MCLVSFLLDEGAPSVFCQGSELVSALKHWGAWRASLWPSAAAMGNPVLSDSVVGLVSGQPSNSHFGHLCSGCLLVVILPFGASLALTVSMGASFSSLPSMTEEAPGGVAA